MSKTRQLFDDIFYWVIHQIWRLKSKIENLERKLERETMGGSVPSSSKKLVWKLRSDLKRSRSKIASLNKKLLLAREDNRRTIDSGIHLQLQMLDRENTILRDMIHEVHGFTKETTYTTSFIKSMGHIQLPHPQKQQSIVGGGITADIKSVLENTLELLSYFLGGCNTRDIEATITIIAEFIWEEINKRLGVAKSTNC